MSANGFLNNVAVQQCGLGKEEESIIHLTLK